MTQHDSNPVAIERNQPIGAPEYVRGLPVPKRPAPLTVADAAHESGTSVEWIRHSIDSGQLPSLLVDGRALVDAAELKAWAAAPQFKLAAAAFEHIYALQMDQQRAADAEAVERRNAEDAFRAFLTSDHGPQGSLREDPRRFLNAKAALLKIVAEHPGLRERAELVACDGVLLLSGNPPYAQPSGQRRHQLSDMQAGFIAGYSTPARISG